LGAKPALLFLTQRIPYPPSKGEKIRTWQILKHLAQTHAVHLGCLVDDPEDMAHRPVVRALCADAHFATLDRHVAKITCLTGLLTGEPLSVTFFRDRGLAAWTRRVLAEVRPQAIVVCSSNMAPYMLEAGADVPVRLVDFMDVDSEKWRQYAAQGHGPMRWVHRREWRLTAALEARIARACDWSVFVSADELRLMAEIVPDRVARMRAIANGVDHGYFDPAIPQDAPFDTDCVNYVFTGTMDYPPNVDAVLWFARQVLPRLQAVRPDVRFHVVGSSPAPEVMALDALPGVFVTGRVPDVRPYLAHAAAAVAPMRIARGIQNKVLEAMAMARPVVVTRAALEGIAALPDSEVLIADDEAGFAAACLRALEPPAEAMAQAARARVMQDYIWSERLAGFDALLAPK
jgi:sugar transferase (PEP-CTERM/EpsH1 system associated)